MWNDPTPWRQRGVATAAAQCAQIIGAAAQRAVAPATSDHAVIADRRVVLSAALALTALRSGGADTDRHTRMLALQVAGWFAGPMLALPHPAWWVRSVAWPLIGWTHAEVEVLYLDLVVAVSTQGIADRTLTLPAPAQWVGHYLCFAAPGPEEALDACARLQRWGTAR